MSFHTKPSKQNIKQLLLQAKDSLSKKERPTVQEKSGNWIPWQQIIATCEEIKTGAYKGLPMILKDQQGHKTRKSSFENETLESMSAQSLEDFSQHLETLLDVKNSEKHWGRFQWPQCVSLLEKSSDFRQTVSDLERRQTFEQLISISNAPHHLTEK